MTTTPNDPDPVEANHHFHFGEYYVHHIQDPGKQPLLLLLLGFILSFLFIRFSVRMIRRGVRWWPGNVTPGGLHIHHVVFGMFFLLVGGIGTFATAGTHPWIDAFGLVFGIGCGLALDEFALLLHLEDVYWSEQGRKSVDAVIVGILFTSLLLVGYLPLGLTPGDRVHWLLIGLISFNALCTAVTFFKGKFWSGILGIMVPGVSWIAAVRLARPFSPWARWRYTRRPRKFARARRREARFHRRTDHARQWLFDLIAGKPTPPGVRPTRAHQLAERVAERLAASRAAGYPRSYLPPDEQRIRSLTRLNRLAARRTASSARSKTGPHTRTPAQPSAADQQPTVGATAGSRRRAAAARRRTVAAGRRRGAASVRRGRS
ncbi:hypothetical protein [Streptacidiphilus sp. P02-A3a]|uniref:hypothetical protein n=1 Tax=Streptacidiphilus sp. P02-A3a TaxID=2704468 RepID=UPI0015FCB37B|nr:hypothetical protein [Streptacidiphilus sp. P02-A3a]QMU67436.1 hypothetical protein GXP74_03585 [Streptacidiphilus sp. P02-A3a]